VLHSVHEFGGLETFITSLVNNDKENSHFLAFFGKDKGNRLKLNDNVTCFSLLDFTDIVMLSESIKADVLHIHWTGSESNNGKGILCFNPDMSYKFLIQDGYELDINSHPFGVTQLPSLFRQGQKPYTVVTCHTEFKLPESVFYDMVVSVSSKAYTSNKHIYVKKHSIIYNGVDPEMFFPSDKQYLKNARKRLKAVWSGRLEKFDRDVYQAIKINKDVNDMYDFYYYGSGSLDKFPLPNHHFMGSISNDKMPGILRDSDVFLYPTNCDSFGLALVEAMLTRLPCINSEVVKEIANDYCIDTDEYIFKLKQFSESFIRRGREGLLNEQKASSSFTIKKMVKAYQDLYKKSL
jgi:glycosyltransferase involved in cell wall biosynthesis